MKEPNTAGIVLVVLGILLLCAICPLTLNNLLVMATSGGRPQDIVNIYSRIFPSEARFGNLFLSTVVIAAQELCATVLALAVLVIGAMLFARSRQPSQETK